MRLELTRCVLRAWRADDAPALAEALNNRNVWLKVRDHIPHPYTVADAETYLQRQADNEPAQTLCIEVNGNVAGGIGLHPGKDVNRLTAELGYWLAEPLWGRGIITEAVQAMVTHGFATLPLERIEAYVFANNPASVRVLEKAGFEFEGRLRRSVIKDGQILDSLLYAKLRE
ncbi:MAG TPA: GNAT family protein [Chthoniobacterales bacterium]|nr:GNAT family protein [Chthoniobacterales bacterium]